MPDEFDTLFRTAATQLDYTRLAEPSDVRAEGTRRRHLRTGITVAAAALIVAAVVGGGVSLHGALGSSPAPGSSTSIAPTSAPSEASPSAGPTGSPSSTASSTVRPAGGACTADDLTSPAMVSGEGAAGTSYLDITVINRSVGDCTLTGVPTLWGSNGGAVAKLPQHKVTGAGGSTVLRAGRAATVTIRTPSGDPGGVQCHATVQYQDLQLDLGTGDRYHPGTSLPITCGDAGVGGWDTNLPAVCGTANFPQPAVVTKVTGGAQIVLTNASPQPCLMATLPALRYTDASGASAELAGGTIGGPATIKAHGTAVLTVTVAQTSGCSGGPVTYHDLSVQTGTDRLSVPGTIDLPCAGAKTDGWYGG